VDVKCANKCMDVDDDQCDCRITGEMLRRHRKFDLCRTSAIMSTEAVLIKILYNCVISTESVPTRHRTAPLYPLQRFWMRPKMISERTT
jgi:hypothetical protein